MDSTSVPKINSIISCVYLPFVTYLLHYYKSIYHIGHNTHYLYALIFGEYLKYLVNLLQSRGKKKTRKWEGNPTNSTSLGSRFTRTVACLFFMTIIYYAVAVLLGASVFENAEKTLSFAELMTILTVLPCCLTHGPESVFPIFTSLMEGNSTYEKSLLVTRLTIFGAWLGSCLIPLDWNRPYQVWPIPCCLGALAGNFLGNALLLIFSDRIEKNRVKLSLCKWVACLINQIIGYWQGVCWCIFLYFEALLMALYRVWSGWWNKLAIYLCAWACNTHFFISRCDWYFYLYCFNIRNYPCCIIR